MTEKNYFLNIYNTMTGEFELVQVTKEVFQTYRRTKWHIEDSTERFYKHETQMSSLIGGENDGYERFHEFIDYDNTPENQAIEEMVRQSLHSQKNAFQCLSTNRRFPAILKKEISQESECDEEDTLCVLGQYLPQPDGGVRDEGLGRMCWRDAKDF